MKLKYLFGIMLMFGCNSKENKVINFKWKYQEGFHIGDVIQFDTTNYFRLDTFKIYKENVFVATIESVSKHKLKIKSRDNQTGTYISMGKTK